MADLPRYKRQLANGLNREQALEQKCMQLELDWKKRCEDTWAKDYIRDKELIEGLTLSRDKVSLNNGNILGTHSL